MSLDTLRRDWKVAHRLYTEARDRAAVMEAELADPDDTESRKGQRVRAAWDRAESLQAEANRLRGEVAEAEDADRYSGYDDAHECDDDCDDFGCYESSEG
jgi:hypothetical protein